MPEPLAPIPDPFLARGVRLREAYGAGLTRAELRGPLWSRPYRGVRLWTPGQEEPARRIAAAAALLPRDGVVGGWAAAHLQGIQDLDGELGRGDLLPVPLVLPPPRQIRRRPGIDIWRAPLAPRDTMVANGYPVTSPLRTAFDLARRLPLIEAVVALDALLRAGLVDVELLERYILSHSGWKGVPASRKAMWHATGRAESPMETRLRMRQVLAGLPCPLVNPTLWDHDGTFLGRPDLFEPESALAQEYDGAVHADAKRRAADAARQERLERAGVLMVRFGAADIDRHWDRTLRRIRQARRDGLRRDRRRDRWQLTALPGHLDWVADPDLDRV